MLVGNVCRRLVNGNVGKDGVVGKDCRMLGKLEVGMVKEMLGNECMAL